MGEFKFKIEQNEDDFIVELGISKNGGMRIRTVFQFAIPVGYGRQVPFLRTYQLPRRRYRYPGQAGDSAADLNPI